MAIDYGNVFLFAKQLLIWDRANKDLERWSTGGGRSMTLLAVDALRSGIVGDGCRGGGPRHLVEPVDAPRSPDPDADRRWRALTPSDRTVAAAVLQTGSVDPTEVAVGTRRLCVSLGARVGWTLLSDAQRARSTDQIVAGNSRPVVESLERDGWAALERSARAWFAA